MLQWDDIINEIRENDGNEQEERISQLVKMLIDNVYKEETYDCIKYFKEKLEDTEIWQEIEHKVYSKTNFYIRTTELRKLPEEEAVRIIQLLYEYIYNHHESEDYICNETGLANGLVKVIKRVFAYCESAVILQKISERRFCCYLVDYGKFSDFLIEELWNLFYNANDEVKNLIYMRYFFDLGVKVNYILRGQDEMAEEINFLEFLLLDNSDQPEEL